MLGKTREKTRVPLGFGAAETWLKFTAIRGLFTLLVETEAVETACGAQRELAAQLVLLSKRHTTSFQDSEASRLMRF